MESVKGDKEQAEATSRFSILLFYLLFIGKVETTLSIVSRPTINSRGLVVCPRTLILGKFSILGQMPNPLDLVAGLETTDKVIHYLFYNQQIREAGRETNP